MTGSRHLQTRDAATLLGVSESTVRRRAAAGLLPYAKRGSHYVYSRADFSQAPEPEVVTVVLRRGQRLMIVQEG